MNNKIYIGNISPTTTDKDLFDLFSNAGTVISAKITFGINNEESRHGFVVMTDERQTEAAISKNKNVILKGNRLMIIKAHSIDQDAGLFLRRPRKFFKK